MLQNYTFRWPFVALVVLSVSGLFIAGLYRLQFESDILKSLPQSDPVLSDARYVIMHHLIHDRIVIDVSLKHEDLNVLTEGAAFIEARLRQSRLFKQVGLEHIEQLMPEFFFYVVKQLPILFSGEELKESIAPLLTAQKIREILADNLSTLSGIEGVGQADLISRDPLGLRNLVLSRLSYLVPAKNALFVKGQLISSDRRHILIIAVPGGSGTDTAFARRIKAFFETVDAEVNQRFGRSNTFTFTPVGAYRAVLDNEANARRNVNKAVLFSTVAVALLLLVSFPRPLIGLLALVPACAGTMLAIFIYSLFHRSISLLAIGFGGAIISFTVDYGIAYLLFLDRPYETKGLEASREVWSLGLLAMLTTAVSFAALSFSGFPALVEIGQFSALGVICTYIFVHCILSLMIKVMPAAERESYLPLQTMVNRIASIKGTGKAVAAIAFGVMMLFFSWPEFHLDLNSMNAVEKDTLAAEKLVKNIWGDITGSVQLMIEGRSKNELRERCDPISALLQQEVAAGKLLPCFVPSMIFPGSTVIQQNAAAWKQFWTPDRIAALERALQDASRDLGFTKDAFRPFLALLNSREIPQTNIPDQICSLLGIVPGNDRSAWKQMLTLVPGPAYQADDFYRQISATGYARLFDPALFSKRFGLVLLSAFAKMAVIVGIVTVSVTYFYFLDWQLTLLGMAPTLFALICTLGTLKIIGQPLGIPILMVVVVVIGMGTDYALYLIRAYQRYLDEDNPSLGLIRMAVFLAFATTLLGFGVLALCDNAMLKSTGVGLTLGIGYSFIGAVTIVPPFLKRLFAPVRLPNAAVTPGSKTHLRRVLARYRHLEPYPRFFAFFKCRLDPMFPRLADFLKEPRIIIDIGSGYGVPAAWLLELFPHARIYGIEPDSKRARFASRAIGVRGSVKIGRAPDMPPFDGIADAALFVDSMHYLTDDEVALTLQRLRKKMCPGGVLIIRVTIPSAHHLPLERRIETTRLRLCKIRSYFRSELQIRSIISGAGFELTCVEPTALHREETWFIARACNNQQLTALKY